MGKLFFCMGKKAEQPYTILEKRLPIYTIEELCYYICKNAELLDSGFMREELADFVGDELGLGELGSEMMQMIHFGASLHAFCGLILDRTCYLEKRAIMEIEGVLKENEKLPVVVRLKNRADYYRQNKEYYRALEAYRNLLFREDVRENNDFRAEVLFQMGTVLAVLFYFKAAEQCFARSMELNPQEETKRKYLLCKRILSGKDRYVEFATDNPSYYESALEALEEYERAKEDVEKQMETIGNGAELEAIKQEFCRMTLE